MMYGLARRYFIYALTLVTLTLPSLAAADAAQQAGTRMSALAMHGQAALSDEDTHLRYANPDAPKGGALKIGVTGTFDSLNPYALKGVAAENMNLTYDRLMRRSWDEPFTLYPLIAESVTVAEDRSAITFHLDPRAQFHDGSPITAEDIAFSFTTLRDHGRPNMRRIYDLVHDVDIRDARTIHLALKDTHDQETVMILAMMPVLSKTWWAGRDFTSVIADIPLGNGAYKVTAVDAGKSITYERVPDYWAADLPVNVGHYNFDTITYSYYRDDTIALEGFKRGDTNLRREWNQTQWDRAYDSLPATREKGEFTHKRPERAAGFIFNLRRAPFDDRAVREALSIAFDRDGVRRTLLSDAMRDVNSFYPNSALDGSGAPTEALRAALQAHDATPPRAAAHDTLIPPPMDARTRLKQADTLLQDAGWRVVNGVRVDAKTGAPMTFELLLTSPQDEKIALYYKKTLARLGITLSIRSLDSTSFHDRKTAYDYDMISFFWQNSLSPGTEQMLYWSCDAAERESQFNYAGICNTALDHFARDIAAAADYEALTLNARAIDRILLSEHIMVPLFYKNVDYIAHDTTLNAPSHSALYGTILESWWADAPAP